MKRLEDWLDFLLFVACMVALAILLVVVKASAGGCLTIQVPPQAVLGNYDGDTFTLFSVQPGGAIKYRVQGVNTPEMTKKEPGAEEATTSLTGIHGYISSPSIIPLCCSRRWMVFSSARTACRI